MDEFRERIGHPDLKQVYDYWNARRGGRRFPARADIDPLDLRFALGNVTLVDVLYAPVRFRIRLHGTMAIQRMGLDLTGWMADEIPDAEFRAAAIHAFHTIIETGRPNLSRAERVVEGKAYPLEILRLPLSDDDHTINMLMLCSLYKTAPPPTGSPGPWSPATFKPPRNIRTV